MGRQIKTQTILVVAAAISLAGCEFGDLGPSDRYQSDFHYTFEMQPAGRIDAESFNGSIEISGWDQNKVEITGTKYASTEALRDAVKIDVHNTPEMVEIRAVRPSYVRMGNMGARFTLHVPRKAMLDRITTSNGPVKVRDVGSASHLRSSNGSINVTNVSGDVDAHTSNGSVEVDTIRGFATLKTSNGRIHAEDVSGALEAETSNNSITVRLDTAPAATTKLVTSNGSIDLTMGRTPKGDIRAETRNNGIKLHLPADAAAHLVADTSNGSISSDFSVASKGDDDEDKKHRKHMDGVIGAGGPTIELSTTNGSIHILKGSGI